MSRSLKTARMSDHRGLFHVRYGGWKEEVIIKIIRFIFPHGNSKSEARVTYERVTF